MERKTRFELATLALARRCSTPEPLPHTFIIHMWSAKTIFCILSQMTHFVKGFGDIFGKLYECNQSMVQYGRAVSTAALQDSLPYVSMFYSLFCGISGIPAKPFARSSSVGIVSLISPSLYFWYATRSK